MPLNHLQLQAIYFPRAINKVRLFFLNPPCRMQILTPKVPSAFLWWLNTLALTVAIIFTIVTQTDCNLFVTVLREVQQTLHESNDECDLHRP